MALHINPSYNSKQPFYQLGIPGTLRLSVNHNIIKQHIIMYIEYTRVE